MIYSIGDLSRKTGVKIPTIRYYEQESLLKQPERTNGNQRRYNAQDLDQLSFIRHSRALGLSLGAIKELIDLSHGRNMSCQRANDIALNQLKSVSEKIKRLKSLEKELKRISSQCQGGDVKDCYVLHALGHHDLCTGEH